MKRFTLILLTSLYLLPAIGFSINMHWCGNKVSSVKIQLAAGDVKCCCGTKMSMSCCKDVHTVIKLTDSQKSASSLIMPNSDLAQINAYLISKTEFLNSENKGLCFINYHAPLFKSKQPVYLAISVFRI